MLLIHILRIVEFVFCSVFLRLTTLFRKHRLVFYGHWVSDYPNDFISQFYRHPTSREFKDFLRVVKFSGIHQSPPWLVQDNKSIYLTFDDGFICLKDVVNKILTPSGIPICIAIVENSLFPDFKHEVLKSNLLMTRGDIEELKKNPLVHIAYHSKLHTRPDRFLELEKVSPDFEEILSIPRVYVFPYKSPSEETIISLTEKISNLGFDYAFDTQGIWNQSTERYIYRIPMDQKKSFTKLLNPILYNLIYFHLVVLKIYLKGRFRGVE
jgi:peptidoglycan/xylan/chitin deacetylase (PgdA/CDA1 family)